HCAADQANGATCTGDAQCANGHCIDGYCCDQLCNAPCMACSNAKKGYGNNGVCQDVAAGADPDNDCTADAQNSCQKDGSCAGNGACTLYGLGVKCGDATCSGSTLTGQICNGFGLCVGGTVSACPNLLVCGSSSSCLANCADDNGCVQPNAYCAATQCH